MKTELHHYTLSLDGEKISGMSNPCMWFLLSIFLIPALIMNVWVGLSIVFLYLVLFLGVKKEKDIHSKGLFKWGLFLLFIGIGLSCFIIMRFKAIKLLLISIFIFMVVYEVVFAIKIKLKVYSGTDKATKNRSNILAFIFGGSGVYCGRMLAKIENTDVILWIMILLCSVFVVGSLTVFQKLLIYKIIKGFYVNSWGRAKIE